MSKPLGIGLSMGGDGVPRFAVTPIDHTADAVWDAVAEAHAAGWTVEQFKREAAEAWRHEDKQQAASNRDEWSKP